MYFQKQANYRARKNKEKENGEKNAKAEKKQKDRIGYLKQKSLSLENKLKHLQEEQCLLARKGKALKLDKAEARQQEMKLEKQLRDVREEAKNMEKK